MILKGDSEDRDIIGSTQDDARAAQNMPSFVKDTTHCLQKIEELNKMDPFSEDSLLVSWDVVAMFPNIDNNLGINAVIEALEARPASQISIPCRIA